MLQAAVGRCPKRSGKSQADSRPLSLLTVSMPRYVFQMTWTSSGVGITVIGVGLSLAGFFPHPILGWTVVAIGLIVWLWPATTRLTGVDPFRPPRVRQMVRLLQQAAVSERNAQKRHDERHGAETPEQAAERAWLYIRTGEFLDRAFGHQVRQDFDAYNKSEEKKLDVSYKLHKTRAEYLERLAARLKSSDLAPGFVMPENFSQFDHTKWPANKPD